MFSKPPTPLLLLLLLSGCSGCKPSDSSDTQDTGDPPDHTGDSIDTSPDTWDSTDDTQGSKPPEETGHTGETDVPPVGSFFDDFEWTGVSEFDIVLDLDSAPTYDHMEVRMCTSTEWWGIDCWDYTTIAHSMSSLDLLVTDDGIIVAGMPDYYDLSQMDTWLDTTAIHALSSPNLEHWGTQVFTVADSGNFMNIDPSLSLDENGNPQAVYFGMPEEFHGDPAEYPGDHPIDMASWDDDQGFVQQADPIYEDVELVDPDLRNYEGEDFLFTTCATDICSAKADAHGVFSHDDTFSFPGAQVPHANSDDGDFMVLGQGGGGWPPPVYMIMNEDGSWPDESVQLYSDEENVYFFDGSCTSPVLGYFDGLYVTICSVVAYQ